MTDPLLELMLRMKPDAASKLRPATEQSIGRIEALAQVDLPDFYRWFLGVMGFDLGPFGFATTDMSARAVIERYETGAVEADGRHVLIGVSSDPLMPLHKFLDLAHTRGDDARVVRRAGLASPSHPRSDTLRESLAWAFVRAHDVTERNACITATVEHHEHAIGAIHRLAGELGATCTGAPGDHSAAYLADDWALTALSMLDRPYSRTTTVVDLGGETQARLRQLLGLLATRFDAKVEIDRIDVLDPA